MYFFACYHLLPSFTIAGLMWSWIFFNAIHYNYGFVYINLVTFSHFLFIFKLKDLWVFCFFVVFFFWEKFQKNGFCYHVINGWVCGLLLWGLNVAAQVLCLDCTWIISAGLLRGFCLFCFEELFSRMASHTHWFAHSSCLLLSRVKLENYFPWHDKEMPICADIIHVLLYLYSLQRKQYDPVEIGTWFVYINLTWWIQ